MGKRLIHIVFGMILLAGMYTPIQSQAEETEYYNVHANGTLNYEYAYEVLELVNQERAAVGVEPLTLDADLSEAAMLRSSEISIYYSHTRPSGEACYTASDKMYGENIAAGQQTPEAVVESWMNSEGHRENILHSSFKSIGIGCFQGGKVLYWTQCFGYDEGENADKVITSGQEEVSPEIYAHKDNLVIYAYSVKNAQTSEYMLIGDEGYFVYGWDNDTNMFHGVGYEDDFQFSSDNEDIISIDETGKFVVKGEGTATLTIALKANPSIQFTEVIQAEQQDLSDEGMASIYNIYKSYSYTGQAIEPEPVVRYRNFDWDANEAGSILLIEGVDYTYTYDNNVNVGTAQIIIKGMGKYKGTRIYEFAIEKAQMEGVAATSYEGVFDELPHSIEVAGYPDNSIVEYSIDNINWSETAPTCIEVGETTVYYRITNLNYETYNGLASINILPLSIEDCTFQEVENQSYTGKAITPGIVVMDGDTILKENTDYWITYQNNVRAGKATLQITGINKYSGTKWMYFSIIRDISTLVFEDVNPHIYTGDDVAPALTIWDDTDQLQQEEDYVLTFENNIEPGIATVTATGIGYYCGTKSLQFTIKKNLSSLNIPEVLDDQLYTGKQICPEIILYDKQGELQVGKDYSIIYGENTELGMGFITLKALGNYTGSWVITFEIVEELPTAIKNLSELVILPIVNQQYTGEQITPEIVIMDGEKKLQKDIDYIVYDETNVALSDRRIHVKGIGNYTGYETLNFRIVRNIADLEVVLIGNMEYTGEQICPLVTVKTENGALNPETDYTVSYGKNIEVGTGAVYITGTGNYVGEKTVYFDIFAKEEQVVPGDSTTTNKPDTDVSNDSTITDKPDSDVSNDSTTTDKSDTDVSNNSTITDEKDTDVSNNSTTTDEKDTDVLNNSTTTDKQNTVNSEDSTEEEEKKHTVTKPGKVKKLRVSVNKKSLVIKWKKAKNVKGYQVQISTNKKYKKAYKKTITKTKLKYTISGKKTGKKYYVRVRAYRQYRNAKGVMKKVYGKWTSLTVKK